jgi:hypothetical protein
MALPLFNTESVIKVLKSTIKNVEVFNEFPQEMENVRNGVYVSDVIVSSRTPYQLGIQTGAHIYTSIDTFSIIYVTYQGDEYKELTSLSIQQLVEDNVLMNGYHQRDFNVEESYLNRAEYKMYNFSLSRIEFQ